MKIFTKNYQKIENFEDAYRSTIHNLVINDKIKYEIIIKKAGFFRIGICTAMCKKYFPVGYTKSSFAYSSKGYKLNNGYKLRYGEKYGVKDIIGVEVNLRLGYVRFWKNGRDMGVAYWNIPTVAYNPVVSCYGVCEAEANYGRFQAYEKGNLDDFLCNIE